MASERVRVFVRVRPPPGPEAAHDLAVSVADRTVSVRLKDKSSTHAATFDRVFDSGCDQGAVFAALRPIIAGVPEGINGTVFVYGQTGTGKTHTMLGAGLEAAFKSASKTPTADVDEEAWCVRCPQGESRWHAGVLLLRVCFRSPASRAVGCGCVRTCVPCVAAHVAGCRGIIPRASVLLLETLGDALNAEAPPLESPPSSSSSSASASTATAALSPLAATAAGLASASATTAGSGGGGAPTKRATVQVSYIQVYNERVYDLLGPGGTTKPLVVRETIIKTSADAESLAPRMARELSSARGGGGGTGTLPALRATGGGGGSGSLLPLATTPSLRSTSRPSTAVFYGASSNGTGSSGVGAAGGSGSAGGGGDDDDAAGGGEQWGTMVLGLSQHAVASVDDIMALLQRGARNRIVRTTQANDMSSRSHTILQLQVTVTEEGPAAPVAGGASSAAGGGAAAASVQRRVRTARLTLVDLAGSERCEWASTLLRARWLRDAAPHDLCAHVPWLVLQGALRRANTWPATACAS